MPDHVRAAVLADIALTHAAAEKAEETDKIRIYLATEQGLDTYEIAEELGLSQSAVSNYRRQGKALFEAREQEKREREPRSLAAGEDPVRSGEREPVG